MPPLAFAFAHCNHCMRHLIVSLTHCTCQLAVAFAHYMHPLAMPSPPHAQHCYVLYGWRHHLASQASPLQHTLWSEAPPHITSTTTATHHSYDDYKHNYTMSVTTTTTTISKHEHKHDDGSTTTTTTIIQP